MKEERKVTGKREKKIRIIEKEGKECKRVI